MHTTLKYMTYIFLALRALKLSGHFWFHHVI